MLRNDALENKPPPSIRADAIVIPQQMHIGERTLLQRLVKRRNNFLFLSMM